MQIWILLTFIIMPPAIIFVAMYNWLIIPMLAWVLIGAYLVHNY